MNLKPSRKDDIIVQFQATHQNNLTPGGIWIKEDTTNTEFEYYKVVAVGDAVVDVKVGDTVMLSWSKMTPPFEHEGQKYAVTSIHEVWAVVEV